MTLGTEEETAFSVDLSDLIRTGVQLNKFDREIPFWKSSDGVEFTESSIRRKPGRDSIINVGTSPVRGILPVIEDAQKVIYIGDLTSLYTYGQGTSLLDTVGTGYSLIRAGGASEWDSGASEWDSGGSVWDEGILQASQWSMINFGSWVLAANNNQPIQIKKNNVNFNDLLFTEVSGVIITTAGSGYLVDDTITFTGGTGTGLAGTVVEVSGGGVTKIEITNFGSGYLNAETLTQASTSGIGTGVEIQLTVPDTTFTRVRVLSKLGPHVLAFNYDKPGLELGTDFAWCSEDDPDTWVAAAANSAGSLTIREAKSEIKAAVPLGDNIAVYTESQLFIVSYVRAPFYFGYRPAMDSGIGAVSINSVVSVENLNYGLSRRGLFKTDGVNIELIGSDSGVDDYIRDNIASTEYPQVTAYHNERNTEVTWSLPINLAEPTQEIFYNYATGAVGLRSSSLSALHDSGIFDLPISGDVSGNVYFEGTGVSAQTTTAETRAHDLGDANRIKELTSLRIGKEGEGDPEVSIGWADSINDTPVYVDSFNTNETFDEHYLRTAGRYLFLKLESTSPSDTWEISSMLLQGRLSGSR